MQDKLTYYQQLTVDAQQASKRIKGSTSYMLKLLLENWELLPGLKHQYFYNVQNNVGLFVIANTFNLHVITQWAEKQHYGQ